jgi:hypothetical protein
VPADTHALLEQGAVAFFYRPRVGLQSAESVLEVQRLFMVLAPRRPSPLRLVTIGRKRMPEVRPGQAHPNERNWAIITMVTDDADALRDELAPKTYPTKTRGLRRLAAAQPLGSGRYQLLLHGAHTELAYALSAPQSPGPAQHEFEIKRQARYIVAVRSPAMLTPGFPGPSRGPAYPQPLREKFGERRWIAADDPQLLNYPNAQLLLIGASEAGLELGLEDEADSGLRDPLGQLTGSGQPH